MDNRTIEQVRKNETKLINENQKLRGELEEVTKDGMAMLSMNEVLLRKISILKNEQNEFITYLKTNIVRKELTRQLHKPGSEIDRKLLSQKCLLEEVLKDYKDIIKLYNEGGEEIER